MAYTKFETVTNDGYSLVDNQTGEIKEFKQVKKVSYDDFMIVFLSTIPEMMNLKCCPCAGPLPSQAVSARPLPICSMPKW